MWKESLCVLSREESITAHAAGPHGDGAWFTRLVWTVVVVHFWCQAPLSCLLHAHHSSGLYQCTAGNEAGKESCVVRVTVRCKYLKCWCGFVRALFLSCWWGLELPLRFLRGTPEESPVLAKLP